MAPRLTNNGPVSDNAVASPSGTMLSAVNHMSSDAPLNIPRAICSGNRLVRRTDNRDFTRIGAKKTNPKNARKNAISIASSSRESIRTDPCIDAKNAPDITTRMMPRTVGDTFSISSM